MTPVCDSVSLGHQWKEGKGMFEESALFLMTVVASCQISGKLRRTVCLLEGRARPQRGWGLRPALPSTWKGKKFLRQKQHELGGESKEDQEAGKSDEFQTRVSLGNEALAFGPLTCKDLFQVPGRGP